ncbi:MAG: hypothetical protein GJ680_16275 [Alteromonadaceae bacterium]|nr:hypothetical protein [Alteromonadaceae bacterium]
MENTSKITHSLVAISSALIAGVAYVLIAGVGVESTATENVQLRTEVMTELGFIEERLSAQISAAMPVSPTEALSNVNEFAQEQIVLLNHQLRKILDHQKEQRERLEQLEKQVSQGNIQPAQYKVVEQEIQVLQAIPSLAQESYPQHQIEPVNDYNDYFENSPETKIQRKLASFDRTLFEEGEDLNWSLRVRDKVGRTLSNNAMLKGVHLADSQCGKTICKLGLTVEPGENIEEKIQMLMLNRPWEGESFVSFDFDGEGEIYFAREGESLP